MKKEAILGVALGHVGTNALNQMAEHGTNLGHWLNYHAIRHAMEGRQVNPYALKSFNAFLGPELGGQYAGTRALAEKALQSIPGIEHLSQNQKAQAFKDAFQKSLQERSGGAQVVGKGISDVPMLGDMAKALDSHVQGVAPELNITGAKKYIPQVMGLKKLMTSEALQNTAKDSKIKRFGKNILGGAPLAAGALSAVTPAGLEVIPHMAINLGRDVAGSSRVGQKAMRDLARAGAEGKQFLQVPGQGKLRDVAQKVVNNVVDYGVSPAVRAPYEAGKALREKGYGDVVSKGLDFVEHRKMPTPGTVASAPVAAAVPPNVAKEAPPMIQPPSRGNPLLGAGILGAGALGLGTIARPSPEPAY